MTNMQLLTACVLSGQVDDCDVVRLCEENTALLAMLSSPAFEDSAERKDEG